MYQMLCFVTVSSPIYKYKTGYGTVNSMLIKNIVTLKKDLKLWTQY